MINTSLGVLDITQVLCLMIEINCPLEIKLDDINNTSKLYFIYESKEKLKNVKPFTYSQINKKYNSRVEDSVRKQDSSYRKHFIDHHSSTSFIYASIAGFSNYFNYKYLFDSEYYTYYFKLTPKELQECCFSITDNEGKTTDIIPGIQGVISVLKKWNANKNNYNENIELSEVETVCPQINVVIPFKIKPIFILPPVHEREYYHGTTKKLTKISAWSYVTPYRLDAISFGVPWDSNDLVYCENEESEVEGRPPHQLVFKTSVKKPRDRKIFIYKLKGVKTVGAKTNSGKEYPWNRVLVSDAKDFEVEEIKSWKEFFNIKRQ